MREDVSERMVTCNFNNTITERDMDLLLAQAMSTDHDFCQMVVDKTALKGKPFDICKVEVSKTDSDLGESDITVVIDIEGEKYGLLIEDKITAPATQDQHGRYIKRGDKGVKEGEYKDYLIFIFCPEKYRKGNSEAKLYEHLLTYEEVKEYFETKDDPLSSYRVQQLTQAISKSKPSSVTVDPDANAFFRQYCNYQLEYYPSLMRTTKETSNGWWPHYDTKLKNVYIHHKMPDGTVDLTFNGAADRYDEIKRISDWAKYHGIPDAKPAKRAKSASIRISVPPFDMRTPFEDVEKKDLDKCFDAIQQLTDLANTIALAYSIADRDSKR